MEKNIKKWLKEICRAGNTDDFVHVLIDEGQGESTAGYETKFRCRVYTHDHVYGLVAIDRQKDEGYLGCTVSTRKARAGEEWNRGNDLPDGPYTYERWQKIKNAIIAYELVKIAKQVKNADISKEGPDVKE